MVQREDWKPFRLDQFGFVGRGRSRSRPRNDPALYGGPYPLFETGDIKSADLYLSKPKKTYNENGLAQSKLWNPGTLCITIAANIAETAILKIKACFPDSVVGFIADSEKADVRYIKYYIDFIKLQMQNISQGTTQDNLSVEKLLSFEFLTPPLSTQRKIATVLSTYDDLIENNTRRIEILEEMAQAIYREWFVEFRFPGHEQVEMVESELGLIPQGWEVKKVKEIVKRLKAGQTYQQANVKDTGKIIVVDQSRADFLGFHDNAPDHNASPTDPIIIFGDHTCKMQLMVTPFSLGPNVIPFIAKDEMPINYLFFGISNLVETREYKRHWTELNNKEVAIGDSETRKRFSDFATPIFEQIETLREKDQNLRQTRDLLLPKLISGELDVSKGENHMRVTPLMPTD